MAVPLGAALGEMTQGSSISYEALAAVGADLVGIDTFEQRVLSSLKFGDACRGRESR